MKTVKNDIMAITRSLAGFHFLRPGEFPRIALYMEQVTQFFEDALNAVRRHPSGKLLTKTMINNYTKEGILHRPKNKKYDHRHLIKLMYVFLFKHVLSMQDIKSIFDILEEGETLDIMYECLLDEVEESHAEYEEHVQQCIERSERRLQARNIATPENLKVLVVMRLVLEAVCSRAIAERMLDTPVAGEEACEEPAPESEA